MGAFSVSWGSEGPLGWEHRRMDFDRYRLFGDTLYATSSRTALLDAYKVSPWEKEAAEKKGDLPFTLMNFIRKEMPRNETTKGVLHKIHLYKERINEKASDESAVCYALRQYTITSAPSSH